MDKFSFALPSGYDWDIKKFKKEVKTKAWVKKYQNQLGHWVDRLTNANADHVHIIGGLLQTAYGVNIGRQIEESFKPEDFDKIKDNIFQVLVY